MKKFFKPCDKGTEIPEVYVKRCVTVLASSNLDCVLYG